jgi:hypothetical protein
MIQIPVHKISSELAEKLNVSDDSYISTTSIKLIPQDNKMDVFFNDQRFSPLESHLIKELPEITKGSTNRSEVEDHKIALIIDKNYKLVKMMLADDLGRLGGSVQPITMRFSIESAEEWVKKIQGKINSHENSINEIREKLRNPDLSNEEKDRLNGSLKWHELYQKVEELNLENAQYELEVEKTQNQFRAKREQLLKPINEINAKFMDKSWKIE